jgi:hypothetical protein
MMETKVSDLQLAAYLLALDYPLLMVEGPNHRRVFIYGGVSEAVTLAYYRGQDAISARKLFGAYRDLRGLINHDQVAN